MKVEIAIRFRLLLVALIIILGGCNDPSDASLDAVVSGNSMAPAFWGEHVEASCDQCGYSFRVGDRPGKLPDRLVCPNCGDRSVDSATVHARSAQRVRVVPYQRLKGEPALDRWDVVAVRPSEGRPAMIKRVIGLPGESIEFINGDVFANGTLVRKSPDVAAAMRVPVFDSQFTSADVLRRLQPQGDAKDWEIHDGAWKYSPSSPPPGKPHWLAYEQWRCVSSRLPRDHAVPVEDWYAANANANRNLNTTSDIWARIEIRAAKECQADIAVELGAKVHAYEFDFGKGRVFFRGGSVPVEASGSKANAPTTRREEPFRIEVCTFDRRLTVMVDGRVLDSVDLASADDEVHSLPMIRIGGRETPLILESFQLWRDIFYYDDGFQTGSDGSTRLVAGSNEYLLVGDNVPVSVDSRHWPIPAVSGDEILGSVE